MKLFSKIFAVAFSAVLFAGMIPQADAQVVVKIGHGHHYRHHYYYRHGHRYYR